MKTWIGIGVVIGLALVTGLGSLLLRNLGADFGPGQGLQLASDEARRGFQLATDQGCIACHSLDGSPGIGPTWRGLYGKTETLADGSTVVVDEAYIRESITRPGVRVVKGFQNLMLEYPLAESDLRALVEFTRALATP